MSDSTKQILAITLGALGLAIGIVATIVAYDARNAANSNEEVTRLVDKRFAAAQARQSALEKKQASQAEKLVAGLTAGEKNLVRKINSNAASIRTLQQQNRKLTSRVNGLASDYQSLSTEVSDLRAQVQKNFNSLNTRIDKVNQRIDRTAGGARP
jgi:chromosome segregation ATPase